MTYQYAWGSVKPRRCSLRPVVGPFGLGCSFSSRRRSVCFQESPSKISRIPTVINAVLGPSFASVTLASHLYLDCTLLESSSGRPTPTDDATASALARKVAVTADFVLVLVAARP